MFCFFFFVSFPSPLGAFPFPLPSNFVYLLFLFRGLFHPRLPEDSFSTSFWLFNFLQASLGIPLRLPDFSTVFTDAFPHSGLLFPHDCDHFFQPPWNFMLIPWRFLLHLFRLHPSSTFFYLPPFLFFSETFPPIPLPSSAHLRWSLSFLHLSPPF